MGVDPKRVMAELLGRVTRTSKRWDLCTFSQGTPFYGGHGIVGQIPLGAGLALQTNILKPADNIDLFW
jgi:pyruvate dehydrogenase E1 component alpha subunit